MRDIVSSRKFEKDGFTVIVNRIIDIDMECETPEQQQANYAGCSKKEKREYFKQDKAHYDAFCNGEWYYQGVAVEIRKQTVSNWADGGLEVGRASVWGVESDSDASYFATLEDEEISEAFTEVARLKTALGIEVTQ